MENKPALSLRTQSIRALRRKSLTNKEVETVFRPVLSRDETEAYMGVSTNFIDKHTEIPRLKIGGKTLFRRESLDRYLAEIEEAGIDLNKRGPKCSKS